MEMFKEVFNALSIYNMLFIDVTAVLESPTLDKLTIEKKNLWLSLNTDHSEVFYQENAINYPEFSRIVAISYASVYHDITMKRRLDKIVGDNEQLVLDTFFDVLNQLENSKSIMLCGDNIISYDLPLLFKRFLANREQMINKTLPVILKNHLLSTKPWESFIIDTRSIWKFNGLTSSSDLTQLLYTDLLSLKKTVVVQTPAEISKTYWFSLDNVDRLEKLALQSMTKVNLTLQLIKTLREI